MDVRPAVVLVRPSEPGNVGATARAMANLGLAELVLVEPAAPLDAVAQAFAVGARPILERARRAADLDSALAPYARVVGTTSWRDRQLPRPALAPRDLPALLAADPPGTPSALLFGPERSGLTNQELAHCSHWVRIPCAPEHPTLNLAQAVLILAYEIHLARAAPPASEPGESLAGHAELEGLFAQGREILERSGFARDESFAGVLADLRQLLARVGPSQREIAILRGICRRIAHHLR
ncbi:MAG: RNA methyltransferase [Acidobacteriota bacterium]